MSFDEDRYEILEHTVDSDTDTEGVDPADILADIVATPFLLALGHISGLHSVHVWDRKNLTAAEGTGNTYEEALQDAISQLED